MALALPQGTDLLSSPDHSLLHRVFAVDLLAPEQSVIVAQSGVLQAKVGMAIRDSSTNWYTTFQGGAQSANLTLTLPTAYAAVNGYVLSSTTAGILSWVVQTGGGGLSYTTSFTNANLSSGILTVTHSLGRKYVVYKIYNNNDQEIIPDSATCTDTNTLTIDLTAFGTIAGTWNIRVVA
jgi:hypothetical protein